MDSSKLRAISNDYRNVRLVSLRDWKHASEVEPHDPGGPYIVVQEGYDPNDMTMSYDEFLIGRSGAWVTMGVFLKLPRELRRQEFVFGTAAGVIGLLESLTGTLRIITKPEHLTANATEEETPDELAEAVRTTKSEE